MLSQVGAMTTVRVAVVHLQVMSNMKGEMEVDTINRMTEDRETITATILTTTTTTKETARAITDDQIMAGKGTTKI